MPCLKSSDRFVDPVPRNGKRTTIGRGIYKDSGGFEVRVTVGGVTYSDRFPLGTSRAALTNAWKDLKAKGQTATPPVPRGTLSADARRYLALIRHLVSCRNRKAHLDHWCALYGRLHRGHLTSRHVIEARNRWLEAKIAPKTINHRVATLAHLFRLLDGKRLPTPCDDVAPLHVPKTPIQRVPDAVILKVDQQLQRHEADHRYPLWTAKTRARFRVLVSTGRRPSEIMRAQSGDVDLEARVWVVRDGKGGWSPGLYLNDDMLAAWQLFKDAGAWGPYRTDYFAKTIRAAGWPADVRPYQARHTTWITASERGVDLEDIAIGAGQKDTRTTRKHYVPVLHSRMQRLSHALAGRFQGFPVVPDSDPAGNSKTVK